jgi:hypothetical protein
MVFTSLDHEQESDILEEIKPQVQRDIISSLSTEKVVRLIFFPFKKSFSCSFIPDRGDLPPDGYDKQDQKINQQRICG